MRIHSLGNVSPPSSILQIKELKDIRIFYLQGPVDMHTIAEIESYKSHIERQKDIQHKHILLDFAKVTHTDTATVAVLIEVFSSLKKAHHKLAMINVGESLKSLIDICNVNELIHLYSDESEAIRELMKNV